MRTLTSKDIESMLESYVREGLQATTKKTKKVIISPGFKIMHTESGLTYTIDEVIEDKPGKITIRAHSGDGKTVEISQKEFSKYQGL